MYDLSEPMPELFSSSKIVVLDFTEISEQLPDSENLKLYFESLLKQGINPRLPENRQKFNDQMIKKTGNRYLIGRYGEDRISMLVDTPAGKEGRTIHMGIDIFAIDLDPVLAPCDGDILVSDYEAGFGEYGNYLIFKPEALDIYIFLGHLSSHKHLAGSVKRGEVIAHLGDFKNNENGGWSRHLHLQILAELPKLNETPAGYSTPAHFNERSRLYPDPLQYFRAWQIK